MVKQPKDPNAVVPARGPFQPDVPVMCPQSPKERAKLVRQARVKQKVMKLTQAALREMEILACNMESTEADRIRKSHAQDPEDAKKANVLLFMQQEGWTLTMATRLAGTDLRQVRVWRKNDAAYDAAVGNAELDNRQRFTDYCLEQSKNPMCKDKAKFAQLVAEIQGLRVQKQEVSGNVLLGSMPLDLLTKSVEEWQKKQGLR